VDTNFKDAEEAGRHKICEIGRRLWVRGLLAAHDGNISMGLADNYLLCTPSGVSKGYMDPTDIVIVDLEGKPRDPRQKSSSELKMHLEIYRNRPDIRAVIHAHPPHATAFAVTGHGLPKGIMPEIDTLLGEVALLPYAQPGTYELAERFRPFLRSSNVFLLSNHGATTIGTTLEEAWFRMESLDACCKTLIAARQIGAWRSFLD